MAAKILDCYVDAELNEEQIEITQGDVAVGPAFMALITRVTLIFGGLTLDSDTAAAGTFDWTTLASTSVIKVFLGKEVTAGNAPAQGKYNARFDIYHGTANAVIAHDAQKTMRVAVWPAAA